MADDLRKVLQYQKEATRFRVLVAVTVVVVYVAAILYNLRHPP